MFRRSAVCGGELYSECRVWLNQIGSCSSFSRSAIRKRSSSVPRLLRGFCIKVPDPKNMTHQKQELHRGVQVGFIVWVLGFAIQGSGFHCCRRSSSSHDPHCNCQGGHPSA